MTTKRGLEFTSKWTVVILLVVVGLAVISYFLYGSVTGSVISGPGECNDGVDNDGDGLIDWEYDLGCYNSEDGTERALSRSEENGWTTFDPSPDTKIIYVSSSEGSDSNDGLSPQRPLKSLSKAYNLVRDNYPDWVLLKRGDVWSGEEFTYWEKSGKSSSEKILISSYGGSKDRPVLKNGRFYSRNDVENLALVGLEFYNAARDPSSRSGSSPGDAGITIRDSAKYFLIEDNKIRFFKDNLDIQDRDNDGVRAREIELRRNVILDSYSSGGAHSQGLFAFGISGLLIEENVFDHNGWNDQMDAIPTQFNHNVYIQNGNTEVVVRRNIFARASSHGVQQRPAGLMEDNLAVENSIGLLSGGGSSVHLDLGLYPNGVDAIVRNNVVVQGSDKTVYKNTDGTFHFNTAWGLDVNPTNLDDAVLEKNIVANTPNGRHYEAFDALEEECLTNSKYSCSDNVVYNWGDAQNTQGDYPDPSRTVEDYMSSIGESASLNAFYTRIREQSKFNWDERFTSTSVNDYIRAGFGLPALGDNSGQQKECYNNSDCSDGLYCNGEEVCSSGVCVAGENPCSDDGISCTTTCDESSDSCNAPVDSLCNERPECDVAICTSTGCSYSQCDLGNDGGNGSNDDGQNVDERDLLIHLTFDESSGSVVEDSSSNSNSGSAVGSYSRVEGREGNALQFDGSSSFVRVPDSSSLYAGDVFSVSAWIKVNEFESDGTGSHMEILSNQEYSLEIDSTSKIIKGFDPSGKSLAGSKVIQEGAWYHVAFISDGVNRRLYLNGELDASDSNSGDIGDVQSELWIGNHPHRDVDDRFFNGIIDDVRIYGRALSSTEVRSLAGLNVQKSCSLDSASWGKTYSLDGESVSLNVYGTNCDGMEISFEVYELDFLEGSDLISTDVDSAVFVEGVATSNWIAEWQNDCNGLCNPPEYFFVARMVGDPRGIIESSSDPDDLLIIDERVVCTDSDGDGYSIEGGECGAIDCNDDDSGINPGAVEVCDLIDNNCDSSVDEVDICQQIGDAGQFESTPASYQQGSGEDLQFSVSSDLNVQDVVFQVWSNVSKSIEAAYTDSESPYIYPSSELDKVTPGFGHVQALVRSSGGIVDTVQFDSIFIAKPIKDYDSVKINFQTKESVTPEGYLADSGETYGRKINGYSYGWNIDISDKARDKDLQNSPDQRYDTFVHLQKSGSHAVWEIEIPNGDYEVKLVSGDPQYYDGYYESMLEGKLVVLSSSPSDSNRWIENSEIVRVKDGRLTLESGSNAVNNKISFLEVRRL